MILEPYHYALLKSSSSIKKIIGWSKMKQWETLGRLFLKKTSEQIGTIILDISKSANPEFYFVEVSVDGQLKQTITYSEQRAKELVIEKFAETNKIEGDTFEEKMNFVEIFTKDKVSYYKIRPISFDDFE